MGNEEAEETGRGPSSEIKIAKKRACLYRKENKEQEEREWK